MRFINKRVKLGRKRVLVNVAVGKPITEKEFDRRTRPIFLKIAKRLEERENKRKIFKK